MTIRKLLGTLYIQVLIAIALGVLIGHQWPQIGIDLKPLGDGFIKLIKMIIGPIIFCTVVSGITSMHDVKQVGRVGGKALLYFEVVSTIALLIGILAAHLLHPGVGFNIDVKTLDSSAIAGFVGQAEHGEGVTGFLLHVIPATFFDAFSKGEILPVLFVSVLFGVGLVMVGEKGRPLVGVINQASEVFFRIVGIISRVAPIGAFGAIAFTIGKYGVGSLLPLLKLVGTFYVTAFFLCCRGARQHRPLCRLQHFQVDGLYQVGVVDRARHQFVGVGIAAADPETRKPGRLQRGGGHRGADRLHL
jgi:aerobic C4-dicarboxylate transport protein